MTTSVRNSDPTPIGRAVRSALAVVAARSESDGDLLERFVHSRAEDAFAELVRRLGPQVLGVARRVLGPHAGADADDVFQATFLVLALKAGSVRPPGRVAAWLYGVASLAARKALAARRRRLGREVPLDPAADFPCPEGPMDPDLARLLDDELARLPERLRLPVLLCELRELTVAQAARELGWPVGTVASRLSRGRAALAARLARRGVSAAVALAGVAALARTAPAAVPPGLVSKTIAAVAAGGAGSPGVVLSLAREVVRTMTVTKLKLLCLGLFAAVAVAVSGGVVFVPVAAAPVPKAAESAADPLERMKVERLAALLRVEGVRKDLGLTDDQVKKIDDARGEAERRAQAAIQQAVLGALPAGVPAGVQVVPLGGGAGANEAVEKAAKEVLKADQFRRLKQISLQAAGPGVLLDRKVIRALGLTAAQEDAIEAALPPDGGKGWAGQAMNLFKPDGAGGGESADKVWAVVLKKLSPDQKAKWEQLVGKMLPAADLQKVNEIDVGHLLPPGLIPGGGLPAGGGALPPAREKDKK